jgi:hypothetical protein
MLRCNSFILRQKQSFAVVDVLANNNSGTESQAIVMIGIGFGQIIYFQIWNFTPSLLLARTPTTAGDP